MKFTKEEQIIINGINKLCEVAHRNSKKAGWYTNLKTGKPLKRDIGNMLNLIHSEISEATEGDRKDLMDDHLSHRKMMEVELGDACIRIGDLSGFKNYNLGEAIVEKMRYNQSREDHKIENRKKKNGKKS